ncbi:hypothetical protein TNIN_429391 [Trichonephila inaurata madagascariensis]|uniref:Uncharacterized protein n=1 Tax=Trichonephila inaurata madagascariensis TaxID=2747483 RepID=A0A8X6XAF1_9ARAC|nr:hypothetical protein TNIN_429391 [Trichonephila inaurata madagascariensis]
MAECKRSEIEKSSCDLNIWSPPTIEPKKEEKKREKVLQKFSSRDCDGVKCWFLAPRHQGKKGANKQRGRKKRRGTKQSARAVLNHFTNNSNWCLGRDSASSSWKGSKGVRAQRTERLNRNVIASRINKRQ